jgi:hypothetical protein
MFAIGPCSIDMLKHCLTIRCDSRRCKAKMRPLRRGNVRQANRELSVNRSLTVSARLRTCSLSDRFPLGADLLVPRSWAVQPVRG